MRHKAVYAIIATVALACVAQGADADGKFKTTDVTKEQYRAGVKYQASVPSGETRTARLYVVAKSGWKVNDKFPWKIEVTAPDGVSVVKATLKKDDAVVMNGSKAVFKVKYKVTSPGAHKIKAKVKLSVCKGTSQCLFPTETLSWTVTGE
jgi:hypothetical protein